MAVEGAWAFETADADGCPRGEGTRGGWDEASPRLIGDSPSMQRVRAMIGAVARRRCTVLIRGESGTGKELVARSIHDASDRAGRPFVVVDCTTLKDTLFESQLFGHARGSFTGAASETLGFVRAAEGGTLFLDEVGELEPAIQAKLLRFLQEGTITPLGKTQPVHVDARVLTATHRDLEQMVRQRSFREDLFYRLNVFQLDVPPLRVRREDIVLLIEHLSHRLGDLYDEPPKPVDAAAMAQLLACAWPGNVRQLANALEHAWILAGDGGVKAIHLPALPGAADPHLQGPDRPRTPGDRITGRADASCAGAAADLPHDAGGGHAVVPFEEGQRRLVAQALRASRGHQGRAAALLRIDRRRLYRLVRRYGLRDLT